MVTAEKTKATLQVGRRSLGSHKPDYPVRVRDLQLVLAGYANWQSGEVESLVPVGSTPTSVTDNEMQMMRLTTESQRAPRKDRV